MKKATSKILVAALSLIVAVAVATGTTFAWFSMNNKVTVTGMSVTTTVDSNILIAPSTAGTTKSADSAFTKALNQSVVGVLQPASTVNGTSFFYTYDAKADGSKNADTAADPYIATTGDTITVNATNYKAYVDYVFELKAMNVSEADRFIRLTKLNLLYDGDNTTNHAFRAAVFSQAESTPGAGTYAAFGAVSSIFAPTSFAYFNDTAVSSTTEKAAVSPVVNNAGFSITVGAGLTRYYKITVRFWLEGEDTDCFNTKFVPLSKAWTLDLAFELVATDGTAAVALIGSAPNAAATAAGAVGSVTLTDGKLTNGETPYTYAWKNAANGNAATGTAGTGENVHTFTFDASGTYFCEITTTNGNVYRTPNISVTVTP